MSGGWNTIESDAVSVVYGNDILVILTFQRVSLLNWLTSYNPLYGVIFLFKYGEVDQTSAPLDGEYDESNESIFFARQRIQNACATQAVLNILLNRNDIDLGPELSNFKEFVGSFDADLKGETISNSDLIRTIHNSFSSPNSFVDESQQSYKPDDDDELFHFIGYVRIDGNLYELDGLKKAPINHGELRFSLLGIVKDRRKVLSEIGDEDGLSREIAKRESWSKENELRRQDLMGLVYQVVKSISSKQSDQEWNETLNKARTKGVSRILAKQLKK
ncbi:unnamed protein product [Wickerhamomyces anomalus]